MIRPPFTLLSSFVSELKCKLSVPFFLSWPGPLPSPHGALHSYFTRYSIRSAHLHVNPRAHGHRRRLTHLVQPRPSVSVSLELHIKTELWTQVWSRCEHGLDGGMRNHL